MDKVGGVGTLAMERMKTDIGLPAPASVLLQNRAILDAGGMVTCHIPTQPQVPPVPATTLVCLVNYEKKLVVCHGKFSTLSV